MAAKKKTLTFDTGDVLINSGRMYKVFKFTEKKFNNELQSYMCYKQLYANKQRGSITCSIPVASIGETKIRKPHTKEQLQKLITFLKELKVDVTEAVDTKTTADIVYSSQLKKKAELLKRLWFEKKIKSGLSHTKNKIFSKLITTLREEIAYMFDLSLKKAEDKVLVTLNGLKVPEVE